MGSRIVRHRAQQGSLEFIGPPNDRGLTDRGPAAARPIGQVRGHQRSRDQQLRRGVGPGETFSVTRTDDAAVASAAGTVQLVGGAGQLILPERSLTTLSSS